MIETLVKEFIEDSVQFQRSDAVGAFDFIEAQLKEYKRKLELSDRSIREFREKSQHDPAE